MAESKEQKIYNVVKRAYFVPVEQDGAAAYTPFSIVSDVMGIEDPWNIVNPSDPNESIGGLILQVAREGSVEGLRARKIPMTILMQHRDDVLDALAEATMPLNAMLWRHFLERMSAEDVQNNEHAYRCAKNYWRLFQEFHPPMWAVDTIMVYNWGIVPRLEDLSYLRLPEDLKVPEADVNPNYEPYIIWLVMLDNRKAEVTQDQIDFAMKRSLNGEEPNAGNRWGLTHLVQNRVKFMRLLESGIVFPKVNPEDQYMQDRCYEIVAWQDGQWLPNRSDKVQEVALKLEKRFGRRAELTTQLQPVLPFELVGLIAEYRFGALAQGERSTLQDARQRRVEELRMRERAEAVVQQAIEKAQREDRRNMMKEAESTRKRKARHRSSLRSVRRRHRRRNRRPKHPDESDTTSSSSSSSSDYDE